MKSTGAMIASFTFLLLNTTSVLWAQSSNGWIIRGGAGPEPTAASTGPADPGTPRAEYAQLDTIMRGFMNAANVPNAQLAVAYQGKLIFNRAYTNTYNAATNTTGRLLQTGITTSPASANVFNEPAYVTTLPNTRFRVASLSKLVTGLAIQQLVLDGKLQPDMSDLAYDILREGATVTPFDAAPTDARMLNVTVKQLVNHEAGFDRDCVIYAPPLNCNPAGQPSHIIDYPDAVGFVKPMPYPYNVANTTEFVRSCKRHLEIDLPARLLHYTPGAPPTQSGEYYQYYTNLAYCWASRVIEIKSGMTYEDYIRAKVLAPMGIDYARTALTDVRDRHYTGTDHEEINFYYDQPFSLNSAPYDSGATLQYSWCAIYSRDPYSPCVVTRPVQRIVSDTSGAGAWVFSAQEYARMVLSIKDRLRAPHLLDFPGSNTTGSDSVYSGPSQYTPSATQFGYYSFGAYATYQTSSPVGWSLSHSGSFPGVRANYISNRRGWTYVVVLNTNPEWGLSGNERSCGSSTTERVKAWCRLHGNNTLPASNTGPTVGATAANSIAVQLNTMWADPTMVARMENAPDVWVDEIPMPCNLDVNGVGNGLRNAAADGVMIARAMLGLRGAALASGVSGVTSSATTTFDRAEKNARDLVRTKVVDVDGDGSVDAVRDGAILLRALLGFKGSNVTAGLPASTGTPTRAAWDGVGGMREYLNTRCAATFAQ